MPSAAADLAAWRLWSLPRRIAGRAILFFFFSRKDAKPQRNCSNLLLLSCPIRCGGHWWELTPVFPSKI